MDVKMAAAIAGAVRDREVAAFCREHEISRQTFYKWKRRYAAEGLPGLEERSRRPARSPSQITVAVEDDIVRTRKHLDELGVDAGAWSIRQQLQVDLPAGRCPSEATIWRVLKRRGLIVAQPRKRPKVSWNRFVWPRPNDLWQIDATHWTLADGTAVEIINIIDDHSRVCVASRAVATCTSERAWETVSDAAITWALPTRMLSDNGLAFNASRRHKTVTFETNLRAVGVVTIASTPQHPQTCGKVERFHQTLKKWLDKQPRAATLTALQHQLDTFCAYYNNQRPHRALRGATPAATWQRSPRAMPANHPITDTTTIVRNLTVDKHGIIDVAGSRVHVGVAYTGQPVTVIQTGNDCAIFHNHRLLRAFTVNPNRVYQPSGKPPGGPKQPRLTK